MLSKTKFGGGGYIGLQIEVRQQWKRSSGMSRGMRAQKFRFPGVYPLYFPVENIDDIPFLKILCQLKFFHILLPHLKTPKLPTT